MKYSRLVIRYLLVLATLGLTGLVNAEQQIYNINLPAQTVAQSLNALSQQTDIPVLFPYKLAEVQTANPIAGRYTLQQAVAIVLSGTGLSGGLSDKGVLMISHAESDTKNHGREAMKGNRKQLLATFIAVFGAGAGSSGVLAQDGNDAATDQRQLDEIVVTAQKREQRLQDVPIAVSAISDLTIEKLDIKNIDDLYGRIPSLFFTANSAQTPVTSDWSSPAIRGVVKRSVDPTVGIYLDDVYQPNLAFDMGFVDLERLEVLRGPQGTLFGRNTSAGAIRLVTKKPTDEYEARVELEAGEYNMLREKVAVSGPIIPQKLAGRLTVQRKTTDGHIKNTTRDTDQLDSISTNARAVFNFTPVDNLDAFFTVDYSESDTGTMFGVPEGCDCFEVDTDLDSRLDNQNFGASLTVNWELPDFTITSATGYRDVETFSDYDSDGNGTLMDNRQTFTDSAKFLSEEIRLASNGDSQLDWLVGAYGFKSESRHSRTWVTPDTTSTPEASTFWANFEGLVLSSPQADYDTEGYAVFGQATLSMMDDRLDLTVGGRYSNETTDFDLDLNFVLPLLSVDNTIIASASETFSDFTPMTSVSYRWTESLMTYFTVAEGFLAGGFQRSAASEATATRPFGSEQSINYELGVKGDLYDRRVSYSFALFNIEMTDLQVGVIRFIEGLPIAVIDNAADARSRGVEFEVNGQLTERLRVGASLSYTDAEFKEFVDASGLDRSGEQFTAVPEWLGSAEVEYMHPLESGLELSWLASYRYIDDTIVGSGSFSNPFRNRDKYDVIDASVALSDDAWKVALYVNNLLDDYNVTYSSIGAFNLQTFEDVMPPRNFGIRASYDW